MYFLRSFVCFVDDKRILIYDGGIMKTFYRRVSRSPAQSRAEEKPGKGCPLITRMNTNEHEWIFCREFDFVMQNQIYSKRFCFISAN